MPTAQGVTVWPPCTRPRAWSGTRSRSLGVHEGSLPFVLRPEPDQVEEERRLLYVGITRARQVLRVSWSPAPAGGTARKPSGSSRCCPAIATPPAAGRSSRVRRNGHRAIGALPVLRPALTDAAERKIGRHATCPSTYDEGPAPGSSSGGGRRRRAEGARRTASSPTPPGPALAERRPTAVPQLIKIAGTGAGQGQQVRRGVLAILVGGARPEEVGPEPGRNRFATPRRGWPDIACVHQQDRGRPRADAGAREKGVTTVKSFARFLSDGATVAPACPRPRSPPLEPPRQPPIRVLGLAAASAPPKCGSCPRLEPPPPATRSTSTSAAVRPSGSSGRKLSPQFGRFRSSRIPRFGR